MARETRALPRWEWPERLEPYRGGDGPRDSSPTRVRMAVAQGGRWRRVQAGRPAGLVGMVSHRPFPGLFEEAHRDREDSIPTCEHETETTNR